MVDKEARQMRKMAREFKKFVREHPQEAYFVSYAQENEPDFQELRSCLGYSETTYFSLCNLSMDRF